MIKVASIALATGALLAALGPASALTMKECSTKYEAAKTAGSLNGMKWNDFRKAQCGSDASAAATTPAPTRAAQPASTAAPASAPSAKPTPAARAPSAAGSPVFPNAIAPEYAKEAAGKARMHTCLDQYKANKANNGNGGLNWIAKGGGYYSECNKHLKG
jgi:hypothetical protein